MIPADRHDEDVGEEIVKDDPEEDALDAELEAAFEAKARAHLALLRPAGPPPETRQDCLPGGSNAARPCGWITCRWYLPRMDPLAKVTCVLDVADLGGVTLEEVGNLMGITRERVRQIEATTFRRISHRDGHYNQSTLRRLVADNSHHHEGFDFDV